MLEFVALLALRIREPELPRPFRAGSFCFAALLGVGPGLLLLYAIYSSRDEQVVGISALLFALLVAVAGPVLYLLTQRGRTARSPAS
jgi:amino acid transporter